MRNSELQLQCYPNWTALNNERFAYRGFGPPGQVAKLRVLRKLNLMEDSTDAHFRFDRMLARQNTC